MQIMHFYRPKLHYLTLRSSFGHFFFSMVTPFCPRALASSEQGYPEIIHRGTGRSTHPRSTLGNRREAFHFLHSLERCRTWVTQTVGKFCSPFLFIRITSKLVPSPFSFEGNALLQPTPAAPYIRVDLGGHMGCETSFLLQWRGERPQIGASAPGGGRNFDHFQIVLPL